jgi:hypothetical protein
MALTKVAAVSVGIGFALVSSSAFAQEAEAGGSASWTATAPTAVAPAPRVSAATTTDEGPDHERVVGHLGVTYFGVSQIPVGAPRETLNAPAIGVRYWLSRGLGIDAGLGFAWAGGSTTAQAGGTTTTTDAPSRLGFLLHGGVPLALASGRHYTFLVVPELNLGIGTGSVEAPNTETTVSGLKLDVGARVGAEIQFGFIGIPELALQASVGLLLRHESSKTTVTTGGTDTSTSISTTGLATTVNGDPWALFTNNISAIYYF